MKKLEKILFLILLVMGLLSCGKEVRKASTKEAVEDSEEYYDSYDREIMKNAKYYYIGVPKQNP
ncbi:hypothetical protein [Fusobacterium sp. PH5-44]|uniref:hypothetical protein n=1 Tax=unclassified Fusobacterium TaxID=2648384 RepID=UPI003D22B636